jgi:hypothetical protein
MGTKLNTMVYHNERHVEPHDESHAESHAEYQAERNINTLFTLRSTSTYLCLRLFLTRYIYTVIHIYIYIYMVCLVSHMTETHGVSANVYLASSK